MTTRPREKAQRTKKGVEVFLGCGNASCNVLGHVVN